MISSEDNSIIAVPESPPDENEEENQADPAALKEAIYRPEENVSIFFFGYCLKLIIKVHAKFLIELPLRFHHISIIFKETQQK